MEKNYAIINGERIELTDDMCRALGHEPRPYNAKIFDRQPYGIYFCIGVDGICSAVTDRVDAQAEVLHYTGNYCRDMNIMQQYAWHEQLNRLLWRASMSAGEAENPWDGKTIHHYIYWDKVQNRFFVYRDFSHKSNMIYFPSEVAALDAIETVILPFIADHPEFRW